VLFKDCIKEFLFECEIRKYTWKTIKGYRNNLEFLCNYLENHHKIAEVEQITTLSLKEFFRYQQKKGCKATYLNGMLKTFRSFFKYAVAEEHIKSNPVLRVAWMREDTPLIQTFSETKVRGMLKVFIKRDYLSIRNQAILSTLFDTGIRCYELCELKNTSIRDSYIVIWGKGNKERVVSKSAYLEKILFRYEKARESYFEDKGLKPDNLFLSRTGCPLTVEAVEHIVKRAGEGANISDTIRCSPHTCRHWFAQTQLRNGLDIYSLSRLLGHSNIKITQRYLESMKDYDVLERSAATSPLMNL
jgi:integrase/recombinase XerD